MPRSRARRTACTCGRNVGEREAAILPRHGGVRRLGNPDPREHPGVDVALDLDRPGRREGLLETLPLERHAEVEEARAGCVGGVHVVADGIAVQKGNLVADANDLYVRNVVVFLVQHGRRGMNFAGRNA